MLRCSHCQSGLIFEDPDDHEMVCLSCSRSLGYRGGLSPQQRSIQTLRELATIPDEPATVGRPTKVTAELIDRQVLAILQASDAPMYRRSIEDRMATPMNPLASLRRLQQKGYVIADYDASLCRMIYRPVQQRLQEVS